MKNTKYFWTLLFTVFFIIAMSSCKNCRNEEPSARVVNGGNKTVSVQIKTSGGNTVNINNVQPNSSTDHKSYAPGNVTFTITVGNGVSYVEKLQMEECFYYDIAIDEKNNISTFAIDRNK